MSTNEHGIFTQYISVVVSIRQSKFLMSVSQSLGIRWWN